MIRRGIIFAAAVVLSTACTSDRVSDRENDLGSETMPTRDVMTVMDAHVAELMSLAGVAGVAVGELDGTPCIQVLVIELTEELRAAIPETLEGYPVDVQVTGEIRPL